MTVDWQGVVQSWSTWYSNSAVLRTGVGFAHVGGLLAGGGYAIAADRATLRAVRAPDTRGAQLDALHAAHRLVVAGLAVVVASGLLLLGSDLDTYFYSVIFWTKMALVLILLANGLVIVRTGDRARRGDATAWGALRVASVLSLLLWFSITLLGVALLNI